MTDFRNLPLPAFPVGATLCSGIGAPEEACPEIDWRFASEIAVFPRAVLMQRFGFSDPAGHNQGERLLWGDMAGVSPETFRAHGLPLPDVLVAGTPCQAFSLAGHRAGLDDPRGNLTLKYVEICHAIQDAKPDGRLFTVWENVPGVLSDRTNAFGCLLAGLVGGDEPLRTPDGKSWPGAGMVAGPRGRAAWIVRDAQRFGCAQRRRRVFLVASLGDGPDPAAVLFERDGLRGDSEARRTARKAAASAVARGAGIGREIGPAGVISTSGEVSHCLNAGGMGRIGLESETMVAFSSKDYGADAHETLAPTLRAGGHTSSHANAGIPPAIAGVIPFDTTQVTSPINRTRTVPDAPCHTLASGGHPPAVSYSATVSPTLRAGGNRTGGDRPPGTDVDTCDSLIVEAPHFFVRRLMPVECHRLQGFPDDHCAIEWRGKVAPDGLQYKALGNSMAVPVMRWILARALGLPHELRPFTGGPV
ncbi:DNA cytosine methyltransferase [Tropicimonas sp. IMCC34043]|uniref:DNA cytosine methyltransferase n=1 Tax=Tropicimonas sp. IMCC34043 TaxID=2248760 RepID=UPI000E26E5A9|nr:DNA cytosine methyltransferase [Tropicimonas sp. IMCC34043]